MLRVVAWAIADDDADTAAILQGVARSLTFAAGLALDGATPVDASASGTSLSFVTELRRETTHRLAERLGDARRRELRAEGEAMDVDQAVALAPAHTGSIT